MSEGLLKSARPITEPVAAEAASEWDEHVPLIDRIPQPIAVLLVFIVIVGSWQGVLSLGWVQPIILPTPRQTAEDLLFVLGDLFSGGPTLSSLWVTVQEIVIGFAIAIVIGLTLGITVGETRFGEKALMPYLVAINVMPKVAFAPLFIAWLGFGLSSKVALAAFFAIFPIVIATAGGLHAADANARLLFVSVNATRWQTITRLKLPSALPTIFVGLKNAAVLVVIGAIIGEFFGGGKGFGEIIRIASANLHTARVFSLIIVLSFLGIAIFAGLNFLQQKVVFWQQSKVDHQVL